MTYITRQAAAVAAALTLSAGPAFASPTTSNNPVKAETRLTTVIAKQIPTFRFKYTVPGGPDQGAGQNAIDSSYAANSVSRVPANSAQLPEKYEWVLGAELQRRADNFLGQGQHELVYHHPAEGKREVDQALAYLRLSNYFLANAESQLGIPHPKYMAEPYEPVKGMPIPTSPPLVVKAPEPTLAAMISMGTPLLQQTIPDRILTAYVDTNRDAARYYAVVVSRMHVDPAKHAPQQEWVAGLRTLVQGDTQLAGGIESVRIVPPHAAVKRNIVSALATLRHANAQISQADAALGMHSSEPTVKLPTTVVYEG